MAEKMKRVWVAPGRWVYVLRGKRRISMLPAKDGYIDPLSQKRSREQKPK